MPPYARRAAVAGLFAACFAIGCNDWGVTSDPRGPGDGNSCGTVSGASGFVLVSHGDTLCTQSGLALDGTIQLRPSVLLHGIQVTFRDANGADIRLSNECELDFLRFSVADSTVARVTRDLGLRWYFNILSGQPGSTTLTFSLWQNDSLNFTSRPIPVEVVP